MTKIKTRPDSCGRALANGPRTIPLTATALLSLTTIPYASTVHAQEEPATDRLEEVLVTARRREESAQTVPIAITAMGADELEKRHITSLESVQSSVPEFSISQASGRPNAPVYGLRGIRPTESIYGQDPTVAVYFADVVIQPQEATNLGLFDLSSVQVLKGPQGTLFGRNTTGGAILMTPKRPGKTFGGDFMVGYGSYGKNETQFGLDMPFSDSFAIRLAGRSINSDGYQTNVAPGPLFGSHLGGESTRDIRLSAVWNVTDSLENYTVLSYDKKDTNGRGMVPLAANPNANASAHCYDGPGQTNGQCGTVETLPSYQDAITRAQSRSVNDVESEMPQYDKIESFSAVNTTTLKLNDALTLKGIGGYRDFKSKMAIDLDASLIPGLLSAVGDEALKSASYEVQLQGNSLDNKLNWVTGLYWYYEDGPQHSPGDVLRGLSASTIPFTQQATIHDTSYSVFSQGTYKLTDRWSLTAGARWTKDKKQMSISSHTVTACGIRDVNDGLILSVGGDFSNCQVNLSDSFSKATGTLSLDFKLSDEVLLYATSRYGYRAGGFNLRATNKLTYQPFQPETVTDLELGTKADWHLGDWKMRSNVAVFNQWYNDIQRTVGVTSNGSVPASAVQNAAKATVFGVELQQTIAPTRNLSLQLNYAFTNPKYNDWTETGSDCDVCTIPQHFPTVDLSNTPFHFTPKHAASGTITYTVPLAEAGEELQFSGTASYKSGVWINALQTSAAINRLPANIIPFVRQEGYTTFDLNASWNSIRGTALDLAAYVKNAGNKEYAVGGLQLYESSYNSVSRIGILARAYGEPRTFGAQLRYHF
jgi:iron complex outermembrane recepter protein